MDETEYEKCRDSVRALMKNMDANDAAEGMEFLDAFVKHYEESLYMEVGRLTRQLHDSLASFRNDQQILGLTEQDIPDARQRLNYVISMTSQAAESVLGIIEDSIPIALEISSAAAELKSPGNGKGGDVSAQSSSDAVTRQTEFLNLSEAGGKKLHANLTEILLAQEYQDITGQIIKRVIQLLQDVEESLVRLVVLTGQKVKFNEPAAKAGGAEGPDVPGASGEESRVKGQDDVDDLLMSLGF